MDRRSFLKAAVAIPVIVNTGEVEAKFTPSKEVNPTDFDPTCEYGNSIPYSKDKEDMKWEDWGTVKKLLYQDMIKVVPEKYRYWVQFKGFERGGRYLFVVWYYFPSSLSLVWDEKNNYGLI